MGFWDSLNASLGYGPSSDSSQNESAWTDLLQATQDTQSTPLIEGIDPISNQPLRRFKSAFTQDLEQLLAIQQQQTSPFQTFDFDPATINPPAVTGAISSSVAIQFLIQLYGRDVNYLNDWQTVEIPIAGNFLKIEFLPAQHHGSSEIAVGAGLGNAVNDALPDESGIPPQQLNDGFSYQLYQRIIIIQFDSNTSAPILAKAGQSFETPFRSVFVTFGYQCPKLRFTSGYNTNIRDNGIDSILNMNPDLGPGRGLWDNPAHHCVPFSFHQQTTDIGGDLSTTVLAPAANTQFYRNLITNPAGSKGVMVGWISNFSYNCQSSGSGALFEQGALQVRATTANAFERTICNLSAQSNYLSNGGSATANIVQGTYAPMRRFTLSPGESLVFTFLTAGSNNSLLFNVEGYSYGMVVRNGAVGANHPYRIIPQLLQHPYPDDLHNQILAQPGTGTAYAP